MAQDELTRSIERLAELGHTSSGVGHHVINAFSAIVSNAEILRLTAASNVALDPATVADMMVRTAVDAAGVARRLIDYTRLATNIGTERVALDQLIAEVVETERNGRHPDIKWEVQLAPVPLIVGHEIQLLAMVRHLLDNAYEAMPDQAGTIWISTGLDERGWVVLEVRDSGQGMEPETLERAIEPFFTTKPGHFGVGLSIANGIWRRHRGTLALRTKPQTGTSVRLCVEHAKEAPAASRR